MTASRKRKRVKATLGLDDRGKPTSVDLKEGGDARYIQHIVPCTITYTEPPTPKRKARR